MTEIIRGVPVGHSKPPIYTPYVTPNIDEIKPPTVKLEPSQLSSRHAQNGYLMSNRNYPPVATPGQNNSERQMVLDQQVRLQGQNRASLGIAHNENDGRRSDIRSDSGCTGNAGSNFNQNLSGRLIEPPVQFRSDAKVPDLGCHGDRGSHFDGRAVANGYVDNQSYYPGNCNARDVNKTYMNRYSVGEFEGGPRYKSCYDVRQISSDGVQSARPPIDAISGRDGYLHMKRQPVPMLSSTSRQPPVENYPSQKSDNSNRIRKIPTENPRDNPQQKLSNENFSGYPNLYIRNVHYEGKREIQADALHGGVVPLQILMAEPRRRTWSPPEPWGLSEGRERSEGVWESRRRYHSSDQLDNIGTENLYESLEDDFNSPPKITPISGRLNAVNDGSKLIRPIPCKPVMLPPPRSGPGPLPQLNRRAAINSVSGRPQQTNQVPSGPSNDRGRPPTGGTMNLQSSEGRPGQFVRRYSREFQLDEGQGSRINTSSEGDYVTAQNTSHNIRTIAGAFRARESVEIGKYSRPQNVLGLGNSSRPSYIVGLVPSSLNQDNPGLVQSSRQQDILSPGHSSRTFDNFGQGQSTGRLQDADSLNLGQSSRCNDSSELVNMSRSHNNAAMGQTSKPQETFDQGQTSRSHDKSRQGQICRPGVVAVSNNVPRPNNLASTEHSRVPSSERIYETIAADHSNFQDQMEPNRGSQSAGLRTVRESMEAGPARRWEYPPSPGQGPPPPPARKNHPRRSSDEGYGSREGTQRRALNEEARQGSDVSRSSMQGDHSLENITCSSSSSSENTSLNRSTTSSCFSPPGSTPRTENYLTKRSISEDRPAFDFQNSTVGPNNSPGNRCPVAVSNWKSSKLYSGTENGSRIIDNEKSSNFIENNIAPRNGESNLGHSSKNTTSNLGVSKKFSFSARNLSEISSDDAYKDCEHKNVSDCENCLAVNRNGSAISESKSCKDLRDIRDRKSIEDKVPSVLSSLAAAQKRRGSASAALDKLRISRDSSALDATKDLEQQGSGQMAGKGGCRSFVIIQTPSPSDSGVGELEAVIKEKELEIQRIRETMEKNENAIMQVLEEKKQAWEEELAAREKGWESKLRLQQQKSFKAEQCLLMQIFKIQQDNKNLQQQLDNTRTEISELVARLENREENLANERSLNVQLSNQLEEVLHRMKLIENEVRVKDADLVSTRLRLKDAELDQRARTAVHAYSKSDSISSSPSNQSPTSTQNRLNQSDDSKYMAGMYEEISEINDIRLTPLSLEEMKIEFERERARWLTEKSKVVEYQKQLQLNYVQMSRRNRQLEVEVQQLTSELEARESESGSAGSLVPGSTGEVELARQGHRQKLDASIVPPSCQPTN